MIGSKDDKFKKELKELIIEECDKDIEASQINDDDILFSVRVCFRTRFYGCITNFNGLTKRVWN